MSENEPTFHGFETPKQNWFRLPNEWVDICAEIGSLAEIKVVQYVMRHTWGYQEYGILKQISIDEFMNGRRRQDGSRIDKGTGLTKKSVIAGVKSAIERGFLIEQVDDSDKARVKKYYTLRMASQNDSDGFPIDPQSLQETDFKDAAEKVNADVYFLYPDVEKVYPRGEESIHRTKKDTLERNNKKKTDNNNTSDFQEPAVDEDFVVVALTSRKIAKRVAERLVQEFPAEHIQEKITFYDFLVAERPADIKKPAAWLRSAIENDYSAPDGFISSADREVAANEEKRRLAALAAAQEERQRVIAEADRLEEQIQEQRFLLLHERYGTTEEAITFWQEVQQTVEQTAGAATYGLIDDAYILTLNGSTAKVGIPSKSKLNQLAHPGTKTQIARAAKSIAKHDIAIEFVLLDDLPG